MAATLSRFGYETHGVRLRLSEGIGLVVLLAAAVALRRRRFAFWLPLFLPLAYVAVETFSTALNRADWGRGFKLDALLAVEAVLAIFTAALVSRTNLRTVARIIVAAGVLEAGITIVLACLVVLHLTTFGVQLDPSTFFCKSYGTMYEANLLASYLGAVLVFFFAVRRLLGPPWLQAACGGILGVAIGLTVTKAVWVAVLAGIAVLLLLQIRVRERIQGMDVVSGMVVGALVIAGTVAVVLAANHGVCGHPNPIFTQAQSITGRFASHELALQEWQRAPLFGLGTGSLQGHLPVDPNQPWISAMAVGVLHDTGLVGSAVVLVLILGLLRALIVQPPVEAEPERLVRHGMVAAIIALLVAFESTTGVLMEYPWLFLGTALGVLYMRHSAAATA